MQMAVLSVPEDMGDPLVIYLLTGQIFTRWRYKGMGGVCVRARACVHAYAHIYTYTRTHI